MATMFPKASESVDFEWLIDDDQCQIMMMISEEQSLNREQDQIPESYFPYCQINTSHFFCDIIKMTVTLRK